jgi:predicted metal-dependent hydrolase
MRREDTSDHRNPGRSTPAASALDGDAALAAFLRAFGEGAFFDAHEILEAFWVGYSGADRDFYKGLIQAAVALHHASTGNALGAAGVGARARGHLAPYAPRYQSVDVDAILARLDAA